MITTINNKHNKLNVPNLRFPEFEGEWEKTKFGDIAVVVGGGTPDTNTSQYWNGKIQWFTPSEIGRNKYVYNSVRTISEEGLNKSSAKLLPIGTILLSSRATVGECSINKKECTTNQGFQSLIPKENISNEFVYYLIQTKRKDLIRKSCGSTFLEISANEVRKIVVSIPTIKEQDKIAKLLSLLDERISTQSKIIDKLQTLIRGIMVELQKQGLKNGTWKKFILADVLSERSELNINLHQVFSVSVSKGVVNQVEYLGRSFSAKDTSKYHVVHYGDIVYTKSPTGSFPYGIVKQSLNHDNVAVSPLYGVYKPKNFSTGMFLHQYFMSEVNTLNYLHPLIQKGAKNTINITNQRFLENRVAMPINTDTLLVISQLLRSLNYKIEYQQSLLLQYQKQKQYLLRQMFI